jgi:hypothetical protein
VKSQFDFTTMHRAHDWWRHPAGSSSCLEAGTRGRTRRCGGLASRTIDEFARMLLLRDFHDYTSGIVVSRRAALDDIALNEDRGAYSMEFVVRT